MTEDIGLFEALRTLRAIRNFRPDPVPRELVRRVLEAATRAPSGGNRQPWNFVVVDDRGLMAQIGGIYRRAWYPRFYNPDGTPRAGGLSAGVNDAAKYLADHLDQTPVIIFVCMNRAQSAAPAPEGVAPLSVASRYASIFPAVQNLQLAARALGLGTTITTALTHSPEELRTLLGIPEEMEVCTMLPLGWPAEGVRFGPTKRKSVEEVSHYNGWGKPMPRE